MIRDVAGSYRATRATWAMALIPLLLLAALVALILRTGPGDALRAKGAPPVERLTIDRPVLRPDGIELSLFNDGPDEITIAQVTVDDAYWAYEAERGTVLKHLGRTRLRIPYPWVEGEAHKIRILTSTGATFEREIPVAVATPQSNAGTLLLFASIGLYVGVIPVALGLLWFPLASRLGRAGLDALLALTVGLLLFLLIDATGEGLELARDLPSSFQGPILFFAAAGGAWLVLDAVGAWLRSRRSRDGSSGTSGPVLALLIATGIGLHNLGEGLAIGAAHAIGEAALGTLLIIGFTLHNATEGLAIVAPIAKERPSLAALARLGLIGGAPTNVGALIGALVYSPVISVLCLGLGAGAIGQVVVQISKQMTAGSSFVQRFATVPVMAGLFGGFALMYATGMIVG